MPGERRTAELQDFQLRDLAQKLQHILQLDGESRTLFIPQGFFDLRVMDEAATPHPDPGDPPDNRYRVKSGGGRLTIVDTNGAVITITDFLNLGDAPSTFVDQAGRVPVVNSAENALQFQIIAGTSGRFLLGNELNYTTAAPMPGDEVQYTQISLAQGLPLVEAFTFIDGNGGAPSTLRIGIYDQVDPDDPMGEPNDKVAETAAFTFPASGTFHIQPLTATFLVLTTGFYWVAFIKGAGGGLKDVRSTPSYPASFAPRREQVFVTATPDLPATASGLTNPSSAVLFAGVEV